MIVIADTSPINYLVLLDEADVLASLYGTVILPLEVKAELLRSGTPEPVRAWMKEPPAWIEIRQVSPQTFLTSEKLDAGEQEALQLAQELHASYLVIDDAAGRREALRQGVPVIGTIGVLRDAALAGLIDIRVALTNLRKTNFHLSHDTEKALLALFE